jgi:hypothetical protein
MNPFTQRLTAFLLCMAMGGLSSTLNASSSGLTIPAIELVRDREIQEITMEVSHGWCSGGNCGDYKIIFQRKGREDYYSSVTRIGSQEVRQGDMLKTDFDLLAGFIESQSFFEFDSVNRRNTWCTDCLITKVAVLRGGQRKRVVSLNAEIPWQLWTIQRSIEGVAQRVQWLND